MGMVGGRVLRNGLLLLAGAGLLAACAMEMPDFLGREGAGTGGYSLRREPPPPPQAIPLRMATAERALHGVIVRVEGQAPTWGFYGARLRPLADRPDAAGVMSFELVAVPPSVPEPAGAPRSRELSAAVFIPNLALRQVRAVRIAGGGQVQTLPLPRA
jgi:hypothetical protein